MLLIGSAFVKESQRILQAVVANTRFLSEKHPETFPDCPEAIYFQRFQSHPILAQTRDFNRNRPYHAERSNDHLTRVIA
jgi:hypothetical protein